MKEVKKMKSPNQKLKLLYLAKILLEKTDDDHGLTTAQIIEELKKFDISAERKSIYDDIEQLNVFGLDICSRRGKSHEYFIGSRDFELPELKLLVDSVQASKFITHKKSMDLISKIEKLTSVHNAKKLQRQVYVSNRVKTLNEQIYYNVDKIHDAIAQGKQISFMYFTLNADKQKIYRKDGGKYTETPISLTWDDENYYMITYKEKYKSFAHYRVDKMDSIEITDIPRLMPEESFDASSYAKSVFSMFGGEETKVMLRFSNELAGVVFDKFGQDISIIKDGENHFRCSVNVMVSPLFLSWVMSFGNKVKILSPKSVVDDLKKLISEIQNNYE
jgi:predicted DNA-binding transcriptional regulator YafY